MPTDNPNVTVEDVAPSEYPTRTLAVDFLFLDREVCRRCRGTEESLHAALDRVNGLLADLGVDVVLRNVHVETASDARRTGLEASPTVRIDGRDVQPNPVETPCESCGELADGCGEFDDGSTVDCRGWRYRGEERATPPVELLVEEVLRAAFTKSATHDDRTPTAGYRLPENLRRFFGAPDTHRDRSTERPEADDEACCSPGPAPNDTVDEA